MVGNGDFLHCTGLCADIPITVNKHTFNLSLYVLPIQGVDVVLGVQWLQTLGPFVSDFTIPSMQFYHQDSLLTITGTKPSSVTLASYNQINRMLHTNLIATFHSITIIPSQVSSNSPPIPDTQTTQSLHPDLQAVLQPYIHIFNQPQGLPPNRPHDHHIHLTPAAPPVNIKPYRYPHYQKEAMTTIILDMLKEGLIQPSNSPYSSLVLLVKKKDGSWRFCVDYRALNTITIKDRFPIPTIDELIDELHGSVVFSKIDLRSGYHHIRLALEDTHKTGFRTLGGHYEFLVMPFELTNAPSTFQAAMNDLLRPFLCKFALVFFDDILFYAKLSKCQFGVSSVEYLGHVILAEGVQADPSKIQAMVDWPVPKNITALRAFLGITGFYRRFVLNYATIASPLTDLLKSNAFTWTDAADKAFTALKTTMTKLPLLTLPDFSLPFEVTTDASLHAVGVVLSQQSKPLAFFSKKLTARLSASSTYIRELYALTEAIKKWRQYLLGSTFKIFTDHKSLKSLMTQTIQTPEQQKWLTKLIGYTY
ncbi:unnamed protein product [Trifolium pratense]|uniref:Uncharacterized protein n=1 Tax=Trifolium pratense TaxID=57577 RepID=A0ACB0L9Q8_TRIPR|nr:unnamed protein product [Trifolium pratense]